MMEGEKEPRLLGFKKKQRKCSEKRSYLIVSIVPELGRIDEELIPQGTGLRRQGHGYFPSHAS